MASLFEHLLQTMPLAGARHAMCVNPADKSREVPFAQVPAAKARRYLRYLDADEDYEAKIPPVEPKLQPHHQPLWWWTHRGAELAKVSDIYCRVRDADFVGHKVLDSVEWGLEEESGEFKQAIRVTNLCGVPVELPLTAEFVAQKWVAVAGWMPKDTEHLWPLEALHDRSLVIAFVYELDPATGQPKPMAKGGAATPEVAADLKDAEDAANALKKGAAPDIEESGCFTNEGEECLPVGLPWGFRMLKGDFMAADPRASVVGGEVGEECKADVSAARILVVLSLTCARETTQFEPAGVVGMARVYPHLMVKASIPLANIEASIRYNRPEKTTKLFEADRDMTKTCCAKYDASDGLCNTLFVADANRDDSSIPGPILPFWSNMFAYYQPSAFDALGRERLHMVRTDRLEARSSDDCGIVREIVGRSSAVEVAKGIVKEFVNDAAPSALRMLSLFTGVAKSDVKTVRKEPRQGEFDNLHLAPRLRLVGVESVALVPTIPSGESVVTLPIDRDAMHLDDIGMAPFCAHDCLHTHWRWGAHAGSRWTLGWDEAGPYRVAGAPMVPLNQDVWIWLRSRHQMTYHVLVGGEDETRRRIEVGSWQVAMYHGSAFATAIADALTNWAAGFAFEMLAPPPHFLDTNGEIVRCWASTALFYWWARYRAILDEGGTLWVIERTQWTPEHLKAARNV